MEILVLGLVLIAAVATVDLPQGRTARVTRKKDQ